LHLVDYTHPLAKFGLMLAHTRGQALFYEPLVSLPPGHRYAYAAWAIFRYDDWLEGGAAWVHAGEIDADLRELIATEGLSGEVRPVVGSDQPGYDEALGQALATFGWRALVAERFATQEEHA
jgi:hypothetical protein